jgi:hypothetical protein
MADIPGALKKIQVEEVRYRAAVSEATNTKIGGSVNAIIEQYDLLPATSFNVCERLSAGLSVLSAPSAQKAIRIYVPYSFRVKGVSVDLEYSYSGGGGGSNANTTVAMYRNGSTLITSGTLTKNFSGTGPSNQVAVSITNDSADYGADLTQNIPVVLFSSIDLAANEFIELRISASSTTTGTIAVRALASVNGQKLP